MTNKSLEHAGRELQAKIAEYSTTVISLKTDLQAPRAAQEKSDIARRESNAALQDMKTLNASQKAQLESDASSPWPANQQVTNSEQISLLTDENQMLRDACLNKEATLSSHSFLLPKKSAGN